MPIQQLRLYDILVDIFPGVVFLSLMYPLIPGEPLKNLNGPFSAGALLAVVLVAIGYATGRMLHYVSGRVNEILNNPRAFRMALLALELNLFLIFAHYLAITYEGTSFIDIFLTDAEASNDPGILMTFSTFATLLFFLYLLLFTFKDMKKWLHIGRKRRSDYNDISNILQFLPAEYPEEHINIWLKKGNVLISNPRSSVSGPFEANTAVQLREELQNRYEVDFDQTGLPNAKQDFDWIRFIGYSRLFASQNLYQRYNTLTTFSRNMSLSFWFPYFAYSLTNIYTMTSSKSTWTSGWLGKDPEVRYLITIILLFIAVLFSLQLSKYSKYRNRQFVTDFLESIKGEEN